MSDTIVTSAGDTRSNEPAPPTPTWSVLTVLLGGCVALLVAVTAVLGLFLWQEQREAQRLREEALAVRDDSEQLRRLAEDREMRSRQLAAAAADARARAEAEARQSEAVAKDAQTQRQEAIRQAQHADKLRRDAESERERLVADRNEAQARAQVNETLRQQALDQRRQALQQVVRLTVAQGTRLQEAGDLPQALLWFAESLRLSEKEKLPEEAHRLRLAIALARHPRLLQAWFHDKRLTALGFRPDGQRLAVADVAGAVRFYDPANGQAVGKPLEHGAAVAQLAFSADGGRLLAVAASGQVHVWDVANEKPLFAPLAHEGPVSHARLRPDGKRLLTAALHGLGGQELQLWDMATGEKAGKPLTTSARLLAMSFAPDGRSVRLLGADGVLRAWDTETGKESGRSLGQDGAVTQALFVTDRQLLATAGEKTARVWQATTGEPATPPLKHPALVTRITFDTDGGRLATVAADGSVRVWDTATGELIAGPIRPAEGAAQAAFSPDGRFVLTTGADGRVRLWHTGSGAEVQPVLRHAGSVQEAIFTPGGEAVLTQEETSLRLWDLTSNEPVVPPTTETAGRSWFSPDGRTVLRVSEKSAQLFAVEGNRPIGSAFPLKHPFRLAAWAPDSRRVLTVCNQPAPDGEGIVDVWDAATGKRLGTPLEHIRPVTQASFSPDGARVLTACQDFKVRQWEANTGKEAGPTIAHQHQVTAAQYSPNGQFIATVAADDLVRLFDAAKGEKAGKGVRYDAPITLVRFSADGARFLTGGRDGVARVWECPSGEPVAPQLDHKGPVLGATFSADGRRVVTLCGDGTARVWGVGNGQPLTPPLPHGRPPSQAALSAEGRWLATAAGDQVRLWDGATGDPVGPSLVPLPGRDVTHLAFTAENKLVTGVGAPRDPRGRQTWDILSDSRPAADLTLLAQFLAGARLDDSGNLLPWGADEGKKAWAALRPRYAGEFSADPARRLAWHRRGADECEQAKNRAGLMHHLDALEAAEPGPELLIRRARLHAEAKEWPQALAAYRRAVERKPDAADLQAGLATAHAALRQWDAARAAYDRAIALDGRNVDYWVGRGRAAAEVGDWERAATDFGRAITLGREDADGFRDLALARLAARDVAGYQQTCTRMVKRVGTTGTAGRLVAWACALAPGGLTDQKQMIAIAERLLASGSPSREQALTVAALYLRADQAEKARAILDKLPAAPADDELPYDRLLRVLALRRLGQADEAARELAQAVALLAVEASRLTWQQRLELGLLRAEAEAK